MPYQSIDMKRTGEHLRKIVYQSGYSVKQIQEYLHLSCPQPIYRWFKGQILPSMDHMFMLSKLFCVYMEDLLMPNNNGGAEKLLCSNDAHLRRMWTYYCKIKQVA